MPYNGQPGGGSGVGVLSVPNTGDGLVVRYAAIDLARITVDDIGTGLMQHPRIDFLANVASPTTPAGNHFTDALLSTGVITMNGVPNFIVSWGANETADGSVLVAGRWAYTMKWEGNWFDLTHYNIEWYISLRNPDGGEARPKMVIGRKSGDRRIDHLERGTQFKWLSTGVNQATGAYDNAQSVAVFDINCDDLKTTLSNRQPTALFFGDVPTTWGDRTVMLWHQPGQPGAVFFRIGNWSTGQWFAEHIGGETQFKSRDSGGSDVVVYRVNHGATRVVSYGPIDHTGSGYGGHVYTGFSDSQTTLTVAARAGQTANLYASRDTAGAEQWRVTVAGDEVNTVATVAAAGTDQAGANPVTRDNNNVTNTVNDRGVRLPSGQAGRVMRIANASNFTVRVYPASLGTINGQAANIHVTIPAQRAITLMSTGTNTWYTMAPV